MTTQQEYLNLRKDLSYPAKFALHYARQYVEIERLERDYDVSIEADFDDTPIRGNAIASGDDKLDKRVEDELIERCNQGDVWAWASVKVTVEYDGFRASDYLGACSYKDKADFKRGGYYYDMIKTCLVEIEKQRELVEN